jgi:hypothetical protein
MAKKRKDKERMIGVHWRCTNLTRSESRREALFPGLIGSLALFEEGLGHLDLLYENNNQS